MRRFVMRPGLRDPVNDAAFHEQDKRGPRAVVPCDGAHLQADVMSLAIELNAYWNTHARLVLLQGAVQSRPKVEAKLWSHNIGCLARDRAAWMQQVSPCGLREREYSIGGIHKHARWRHLFKG